MRRFRPFLMLALALVSGGLAAYLALRYLRQQASPLLAADTHKVGVVVAARPLPIGSLIGPKDVRTMDWTGPALPVGYLRSADEAVGRGVVSAMVENEPLLAGKLAEKGSGGGLPVMIAEGMRAVSVRVDEVVGVAGFVLPNTRVDVLMTVTASAGGASEPSSRVILQNVRTLAAGQSVQQDKDGKPQTVTVITLLVTPEQAEMLALASSEGRIQLALRNTLDSSDVETRGTRVSSLVGTTPRPVVLRSVATPRPTPPDQNQTVVEVYKGGVRTLMKF